MDCFHTDSDFDTLSWHDCRIWGMEFRTGDADDHDWTSDLALDIDFILEWHCGTFGPAQFRIAPACFVFHRLGHQGIAGGVHRKDDIPGNLS